MFIIQWDESDVFTWNLVFADVSLYVVIKIAKAVPTRFYNVRSSHYIIEEISLKRYVLIGLKVE